MPLTSTLIKLAVALDEADGFGQLFPARPDLPSSMAQLDHLYQATRKRGRTLT